MRIQQQPLFILNTRPYSESSLLLDGFSRDFGRVMLLAKGARRLKSRHRGVLRPFTRILTGWSGKRDLFTLTQAETAGPPVRLPVTGLMCGFYMNELIQKFMQRLDPHENLFDEYEAAIRDIAAGSGVRQVLRRFETMLLREIGYELRLDFEADGQTPVREEDAYVYDPLRGPVPSSVRDGSAVYRGKTLKELATGENLSGAALAESRRLLRQVIDFYLEGRVIRSRRTLEGLRRYVPDHAKEDA